MIDEMVTRYNEPPTPADLRAREAIAERNGGSLPAAFLSFPLATNPQDLLSASPPDPADVGVVKRDDIPLKAGFVVSSGQKLSAAAVAGALLAP